MNIQSGYEPTPTGLRALLRNIDCKVGGPIGLAQVPNTGRVLVLNRHFFGLVQLSGLVTPPSISIGTNGPNYDNIMAITALTGLTQGNLAPGGTKNQYPWLAAGAQVFLNITTPANAAQYIVNWLALLEWF